MTLRALAVAALVLLPSLPLAAPEAFRCEKRGGSAWRELRTDHFVLDTDLAPAEAGVLARQLEELHALELRALVGEVVDIPGRLRVVALRDPRQFRDLAGEDYRAYYRRSPGRQAIVLQSEGLRVAPEVVAHELVHHLSSFLFPRQAPWFAEGLAHFVQTVAEARKAEFAKTGSHIARAGADLSGGRWVGLAPSELANAIRVMPLVPVRQLLAWNGTINHALPDQFHLSSWLLYHYLWNKRSRELGEYQRRLGDGESPATAWRAAFPEYDPERPETLQPLDAELERYRRGGRFTSYQVPLVATEVVATERDLSSADVHLVIAGARLYWPERPAEAKALVAAEVDEALREDPGNPEALARRAARERTPVVVALRAATVARPNDWRAWYFLATQLTAPRDAVEREASCRKALALDTDAPAPQNDLAWLLVESGRAREALPFANRAVDLAPWDPAYLDTLATVALELGQCPQALQLAQRAVETAEGGLATTLKRHQEQVQRRCATPASSATTVPLRP